MTIEQLGCREVSVCLLYPRETPQRPEVSVVDERSIQALSLFVMPFTLTFQRHKVHVPTMSALRRLAVQLIGCIVISSRLMQSPQGQESLCAASIRSDPVELFSAFSIPGLFTATCSTQQWGSVASVCCLVRQAFCRFFGPGCLSHSKEKPQGIGLIVVRSPEGQCLGTFVIPAPFT